MPEITAMTNAALAASRMTPADYEPYRGEFIAWSPDGSRIIAHAAAREDVSRTLDSMNVDTRHCVVQYVPTDDDRI